MSVVPPLLLDSLRPAAEDLLAAAAAGGGGGHLEGREVEIAILTHKPTQLSIHRLIVRHII